MPCAQRYMQRMARKGAERSARSRAKLRAAGLRPIQIWVPDTRSPAFRREAERQSKLIAQSTAVNDALEFMESIAAFDDDER